MRIAVWNTAFLGDSVLTLPLLQVLKAAWPAAELDFYVRGGLAALYEAQPEISHVYTCDKRGQGRGINAMLHQGREVASRKYDLWVDAHLSLRSSFMAWASHASIRVGYREAAASQLVFTHRISRGFHEMQEIERLLQLAHVLDIPQSVLQNKKLHWPELKIPDNAYDEAEALLSVLPQGPVIGIHPGSVWPTKRWTPEGFAFILRKALEQGISVVLLAGPGEESAASDVRRLSGVVERNNPHFLDLSGKTSLLSLAAVLSKLQVYVTNDSGPMHLAWVQHTPVTAIFGPTVASLGFAPRGTLSTIIEVDEPCRPCGLHGHASCPHGHFRCMNRIDPHTVWDDVLQKLCLTKE